MVPQEQKLLKLLSNNDVTFFIPPYQRNYEWTDEQCNIFFEDVIKTAEINTQKTTAEHFFGSITYYQAESVFGQPDKLVLIDGQQRITTTMLFLAALRDIIEQETLKNYINQKYLKNSDNKNEYEYKIKLKQVEADWESYKKIILNEPLTKKEQLSAVYHNYQSFYGKLSSLKKKGINLEEIISNGLEKFSIITIELQPFKNKWENPQEIFESMNSIGKPLTFSDLVRNYLFLGLTTEKQTELYTKYWLYIENKLKGRTSDFIRDYMQACQRTSMKKATEKNYKELYIQFKNFFKNKKAEDILKTLHDNVDIYDFITDENSFVGEEKIDEQLSFIKKLKVTTANSFLMVLFQYWKKNLFTSQDITDILEAFKTYIARRRILVLTQAENNGFPKFINYIEDLRNSSNKKEKFFEILSQQGNSLRLPNDIEVKRELDVMNFYSFKHCKYFLSLIEEKITKNRPDDNLIQVEHIMPKSLNDSWKNELGDNYEKDYQELIDNIGNLTLIRHNQELGNKSFEEKKKIYINKAGLQIAKTQIIDKEKWNKESINLRKDWIVEILLKEIFPIPEKFRYKNNYKTKPGKRTLEDLIGLNIEFCKDKTISAKVINDSEVEFEGIKWRLSPLTREIQERRGKLNNSGDYSGYDWWEYDGIKLSEM